MVSRAASWPRSARATDMGVTLFDPLGTLVRLDVDGRADALPRSPDAWRQVNRAKASRVLGMSEPKRPEDLHPDNWEMHPDGDEILHLVEGDIDLVVEGESGEILLPLARGQSCVVERGTWHRLLLRAPSRLMFLTPAGGTRMRPLEA